MKLYKIGIICLFLVLLSCSTREKIVYFQEEEIQKPITFDPVFKNNDLLNIIVYSPEESNSKIFNITSINSNNNNNRGYLNGNAATNGYLIDSNGEIEFPVIGKLKFSGLKRFEAIKLLESKLSEYIASPIIFIQIINFKITILGDVKSPGSFLIPNEKISVIEALGLAGDLNITANRKNIKLLREENGETKKYNIDLTKNELINSSLYYLSQNDVLYIEPNKTKINSSRIGTSTGIILSTASLFISTLNLLIK